MSLVEWAVPPPAWGSAFIRIQGRVLGLPGLTLLVNSKYKNGNLKLRKKKEKRSGPNIDINQDPSNKGATVWGRQPGSLVASNVFIPDSPLWSGCVGNQSLNQALALQKRKKELPGFTLQGASHWKRKIPFLSLSTGTEAHRPLTSNLTESS